MESLRKLGRITYKAYVGVGMLAVASMAVGVIFAVIMRYVFSISFSFLEELITVIFTFTTFWGVGICILENEHIIIDFFVQRMHPKARRILDIFNYTLVLIINCLLVSFSVSWIQTAGKIVSNGLRVKYVYIYSLMPVGLAIGVVCTLIKLAILILDKEAEIRFKPEGDDGISGGQAGA